MGSRKLCTGGSVVERVMRERGLSRAKTLLTWIAGLTAITVPWSSLVACCATALHSASCSSSAEVPACPVLPLLFCYVVGIKPREHHTYQESAPLFYYHHETILIFVCVLYVNVCIICTCVLYAHVLYDHVCAICTLCYMHVVCV